MVGRKHIQKRVWLTDIKNTAVLRCIRNKFIGYILGTCIFENSMNLKFKTQFIDFLSTWFKITIILTKNVSILSNKELCATTTMNKFVQLKV